MTRYDDKAYAVTILSGVIERAGDVVIGSFLAERVDVDAVFSCCVTRAGMRASMVLYVNGGGAAMFEGTFGCLIEPVFSTDKVKCVNALSKALNKTASMLSTSPGELFGLGDAEELMRQVAS